MIDTYYDGIIVGKDFSYEYNLNKAGENMEEIKTIEQLHSVIAGEGLVVLEIASKTCAPCINIQRKIKAWAEQYPDIVTAYLEIELVPQAAGALQIFTAPAVLVYFDGKLCVSKAGYFSLDEVFWQIERYMSMM